MDLSQPNQITLQPGSWIQRSKPTTIKKTQSHDGSGQQQQTSNSYDAFGSIGKKKGEQEKKEMEVVIGKQHPTTFPKSSQPNHSSPEALDDVISSIQSLPTLSPPAMYRAIRLPVGVPGAYAVEGIGPTLCHPTSRPADMEELGLELVPASQDDRDHDTGLIHAAPIEEPEYGMIPTAEPITKRAKRLWKKKLCLFLSLETMFAQALVVIILVAFLLAPKSSNQTQPTKQQNGVIPIQENPGTIASITQAPISLWERLNLPDYTLRAMENPRSPQTKAYQWLSNNVKTNNTQHLPVWRLKQRFALATFYYSTRGDYWVKNQGWLDWYTNECNWEQIDEDWAPNPPARCANNGQLLSLQFMYANNLDGTMPPEISLLHESLEAILLSWNLQLKGNIPTEVGLMTRLTSFLLSTTLLSGTLPAEIGQLRSLKNLSISHSKIGGTLPTELGNLSNLTALGTEGANFSGSIPTEILRLSNLKTLSFLKCPLLDITSFLPGVVGNLHNLKILGLGSGKPGGFTSIPSEIGKLTNMRVIGFTDFQVNGTIPSEMGLLTKLNNLNLQSNSISGTLPEELSKMSQLEVLRIQSNKLEGKILEQGVLHHLNKLRLLQISDNLFSGSIATEIGLWSSLKKLELQNTHISGTLPSELLLLDNFTSLVVMNTSLTGSIPHGLCNKVLLPQENKCFGGRCYGVATSNLSACHGAQLCGCSCTPCPIT
ncbi:Leucine Rich Repeat [Seminavis robusta]|uniref:Leucine Rich Repeat n=1 Tax=Seminavis robusta TaxID=568900 RepID=A0A9N8HDK7_9STRA|nr:Leucine Rich Repeat [Seminavis robusta]|eukprot:Sro432_g141650.1 Leucine Rich Repeat (714) ;mRNA; f:33333-35783